MVNLIFLHLHEKCSKFSVKKERQKILIEKKKSWGCFNLVQG